MNMKQSRAAADTVELTKKLIPLKELAAITPKQVFGTLQAFWSFILALRASHGNYKTKIFLAQAWALFCKQCSV